MTYATQFTSEYKISKIKEFPGPSFAVTLTYFENGVETGRPIVKVGQAAYLRKMLKSRYGVYF